MNEETKKQIEKLDNRRSEILYALCENAKIFHPELLLSLIQEVRAITRILKALKGDSKFK